jgi:hypothetical protein
MNLLANSKNHFSNPLQRFSAILTLRNEMRMHTGSPRDPEIVPEEYRLIAGKQRLHLWQKKKPGTESLMRLPPKFFVRISKCFQRSRNKL